MRAAVLILLTALAVAAPARAAEPIVLEDVKTEWQNLYGAIVYAATATAHNTSDAPVRAVKVRLTLYDKTGAVVVQRDGYNLAAEQLAENPDKRDAVTPIPPGGRDPVRMGIDKTEIGKPFRKATLTVVEVVTD